jgi:two-component system, sensor histidine kinase
MEAQSSGLLLLHKPVLNSRLRAAIVNLIAASERSEQAEQKVLEPIK